MLKAPCWWGCSTVRGFAPPAPQWNFPLLWALSVGGHYHSSDTDASLHWECWDNCCELFAFIWCEEKKEISFKKKSAGGVCSWGGFAAALEGTPCCLQQVISLVLSLGHGANLGGWRGSAEFWLTVKECRGSLHLLDVHFQGTQQFANFQRPDLYSSSTVYCTSAF